MKGAAINLSNQPKILSLSPNGSGGVKIFASMNLTQKEKLELLNQAIEYLKERK